MHVHKVLDPGKNFFLEFLPTYCVQTVIGQKCSSGRIFQHITNIFWLRTLFILFQFSMAMAENCFIVSIFKPFATPLRRAISNISKR